MIVKGYIFFRSKRLISFFKLLEIYLSSKTFNLMPLGLFCFNFIFLIIVKRLSNVNLIGVFASIFIFVFPICLHWFFSITFFLFSKRRVIYFENSKILIQNKHSKNLNFTLKRFFIIFHYTCYRDFPKIHYISNFGAGKRNVIHLKNKKTGKSHYAHFQLNTKEHLDEFENVLKEWYKSGIEFQYKKRLKKINVEEYFWEK